LLLWGLLFAIVCTLAAMVGREITVTVHYPIAAVMLGPIIVLLAHL
jgi:hypothetical protein